MKKVVTLFITVVFMLIGSGCSYVAYKDYYSNVQDYTQIWDFPGIHNDEKDSFLFPESVEQLDVEEFFCRYDEQLPLGEGAQILLKIQYDDELKFNAEFDRILSFTFNCDEYFEQTELSVYASYIGVNYSSEYAFINEEQQEITYVYLQYVPKEEVEINHQLLPFNYKGYGEI